MAKEVILSNSIITITIVIILYIIVASIFKLWPFHVANNESRPIRRDAGGYVNNEVQNNSINRINGSGSCA